MLSEFNFSWYIIYTLIYIQLKSTLTFSGTKEKFLVWTINVYLAFMWTSPVCENHSFSSEIWGFHGSELWVWCHIVWWTLISASETSVSFYQTVRCCIPGVKWHSYSVQHPEFCPEDTGNTLLQMLLKFTRLPRITSQKMVIFTCLIAYFPSGDRKLLDTEYILNFNIAVAAILRSLSDVWRSIMFITVCNPPSHTLLLVVMSMVWHISFGLSR